MALLGKTMLKRKVLSKLGKKRVCKQCLYLKFNIIFEIMICCRKHFFVHVRSFNFSMNLATKRLS